MSEENKPGYYAIIPSNVRYCKELKFPERLLYGEITSLLTKEGYCFASNRYFADLYGVIPGTISRWISHLESLNFIKVVLIRNEKKQIIQRRIYITDISYNTYIACTYEQDKQYPYILNEQYPISKKAKDINISQETPKDISGLMQPGNDIQSEPIIREDEGLNQVNLENNRFINVAPEPQQQKKVQPVNNSGVTFDSMFNQHVNIEPNPTNNVQNNVNDSVKATMSSSNLQNNVTQVNTVSAVTPISNVSVEPTVTPLNSSPSEVNANTGIPEVTPVVNNQDEVSDDTKKEISSAVADALRRFNQKKKAVSTPAPTVAEPIAPQVSASVPEPSISSINTPVEPVSNINPQVSEVNIPSAESAIPSTDIISDNALNEYAIHSDTAGTMASSMVQDVKPVNNQAHFAEIVKLLRDCADKIEQSGYFVNVDELDLGNQYKVTFTINKE